MHLNPSLLHLQSSNEGVAVKVHMLVDGPLTWRLGYASDGSVTSRLSAMSVYLHVGRSNSARLIAHNRLNLSPLHVSKKLSLPILLDLSESVITCQVNSRKRLSS